MCNSVLLICDLDNTLYNWHDYFVPAFYAMVDSAVAVLNCDREELLDDLRAVHQRHHDSEHPYALLETETVRKCFPEASKSELVQRLNVAFHSFNSTRKRTLHLYDDVLPTLTALKSDGTRLVAHTESRFYSAVDRLNRLGLIEFFDRVYCRERQPGEHPSRGVAPWLPDFPFRKIIELPKTEVKPNPDVLRDIASQQRTPLDHTAYIGDSLARDVSMAKSAGAFAIWAAYGAHHDSIDYEKLVRVTHWTSEDVEREKRLRLVAEETQPDFTCSVCFGQTLHAISKFRMQMFGAPSLGTR